MAAKSRRGARGRGRHCRGVDGQHQGFVGCGLDPGEQLTVEAAVVLKIELEPQGASFRVVGDGGGDSFQRDAGLGAHYHAGTLGGGGMGAGELAVGMGEPLEGHRREQDGVGERAPEQGGAGASCGEPAQYPRVERNLVPRLAVGAKGVFIARTTLEVGEGVGVEAGAGERFVIGEADQAGREALWLGCAHVSAHMRSRLW